MISLADDHYYSFHLSNFAGTKSSKPCSANWHNLLPLQKVFERSGNHIIFDVQ